MIPFLIHIMWDFFWKRIRFMVIEIVENRGVIKNRNPLEKTL